MGKHFLSQILLSVVFKGLAELNSRDFGQKTIKIERNLCHLLLAAQPFRTCPSQEEDACLPSIDPKTQGQDVSLWSRSDRLCLHLHCVPDSTRHETVRILPWQPAGAVLASGCLQHASSTSDLGGKVGRFMLQIFTILCCFLLKALIRMVWWTSERALTQFLGHECCALCYCWVTRNATLHPCLPVLHMKWRCHLCLRSGCI